MCKEIWMPQRHKRNKALMYNELRAIGRKCKGWIMLYPSVFGRCQEIISLLHSFSVSPKNLFLFTSLSMCVSPTSLSLSFRVNFSLFTPLYLCFSIISFFLSFSSVSCTQHSWWFCVCNSMRVWWDWMLRCLCFHKKEQKMR